MSWVLEDTKNPEHCIHCGSADWLYGVSPIDSRLVRRGTTRLRKALNKGVKSKRRQDQGLAQWRRFKPKEPLEPKP